MRGERCAFRDPEHVPQSSAPPCPNTSEADSLYCAGHRAYGWKAVPK